MEILTPSMPETLVLAACRFIGTPYDYKAGPHDAPWVFNCQTFIWWVFTQCGIPVPHLLSEQVQLGIFIPHPRDIGAGDLVFSRGSARGGYVFWDRGRAHEGVGHIGLATGVGAVLHASSKARAVVEEPLLCFLNGKFDRFRGAVRLL